MKALFIALWFCLSPIGFCYTVKNIVEIDNIGQSQVAEAIKGDYPIGWTQKEWQSVIDCTNEPGNGGDWSCDSCYIAKCHIYHHRVDSTYLW